MEKHKDDTSILTKLDLDDIEKTTSQPYHETGPGRPPRKPLDIFKALMIKQLRCIPSDRKLYRRLWNDESLREICDIEDHAKPYHPSQLTRFRNKVGPERLEDIMNILLEELVEGGLPHLLSHPPRWGITAIDVRGAGPPRTIHPYREWRAARDMQPV